MSLLTEEIRQQIPKLDEQKEKGLNTVVYAKFKSLTNWYWFITEFDGKDLLYGYVCGLANEWGYIDLHELEEINYLIESELNFKPKKLSECLKDIGALA